MGLKACSPGRPANTALPDSTSTKSKSRATMMPGFRPEAISARNCDKPSRPGPTSFARLIGVQRFYSTGHLMDRDPPVRLDDIVAHAPSKTARVVQVLAVGMAVKWT